MQLIDRLNEPFPGNGSQGSSLLSLTGVGVFVALFLLVLQPFGLSQMKEGLWLVCAGFGLVTIVFGSFYDALFRYVLPIRTDLPSWTLGKWILRSCGLLVWVAIGNSLYMTAIFQFATASVSFFFGMILNTTIVGLFPIVFSGLRMQLKAAKANRHKAEEMQPDVVRHQTAPAPATPNRSSFSISEGLNVDVEQIRYAESMQNYVSIHFESEQGIQKETVRDTIANFESRFQNTSIVRCHRSYLVNIESILSVDGNAQGLKLQLKGVDGIEVPVSRSYVSDLRAHLASS